VSRASRPALIAAVALALGAASCSGAAPSWVLTWSDEFNGSDGSSPDPTKWTVLQGGDGWGNGEREYYTPAAVQQKGGSLVITADTAGASAQTCWYGPCTVTSARLENKGLFAQQYGRMEARIQIPRGQGVWPAFWMLGANEDTTPWPACGEIDIMENKGSEPQLVHGSMHGPGYSGGAALTAPFGLADGAAFAADYHVYAVEWDASEVRFYVDDTLYERRAPEDAPSGAPWVFDHPFFLLLNLAIGGNYGGDPDATTSFPLTMKVDYVRVYKNQK